MLLFKFFVSFLWKVCDFSCRRGYIVLYCHSMWSLSLFHFIYLKYKIDLRYVDMRHIHYFFFVTTLFTTNIFMFTEYSQLFNKYQIIGIIYGIFIKFKRESSMFKLMFVIYNFFDTMFLEIRVDNQPIFNMHYVSFFVVFFLLCYKVFVPYLIERFN